MAIPISDIYVRLGDQNAVTEIKFVQGGWISTGSLADIQGIHKTRIHDKQIAYSTDEGKFYIAEKIKAVQGTSPFDPGTPASLNWYELPIGFPYTGSAGITGSLVVDGPISASLFSGSFYGDGSNLTGIGSGILSMSGSFGSSSVDLDTTSLVFTGSAAGIIPTVSASHITFEFADEISATGSFSGSFTGSFSGSLAAPGTDGYVLYNSSSLVQATTALYFDDENQRVGIGTDTPTKKLDIHGDALITGSLTVQGRVTAEEFHTEFVSASIVYQSGSTKFGDTSDDVHSFSGSLRVTGSGAHYFLGGNVGIGIINPSVEFMVSGSISASGAIYDNSGSAGTSGQMIQSTGTGYIWTDNVAESAQDLIVSGKNMLTSSIAKGTPVYFSGSNTQGNIVGVYPADAGNPDRMPAGGITAQTLGSGSEGSVYIYGFINGVNTSAFNAGDDVFVAVGGGYTNVKPTGSALIQKLGNVEKAAVNGSGIIQGPSWYNDLPNWEEGKIKVGTSDSQPVTSSLVHLDETNSRLGIGTDSPSQMLHVSGAIRLETYGEGGRTSNDITYALGVDSSGNVLEMPHNTGANVDVDTGTEVVDQFSSGSVRAAFTNYYVLSGSNMRAGQLMSIWSDVGTIEYTDVSTNSIGDTSGVFMTSAISASMVQIKATVDSDNWTVKVNTSLL